MNLPNSAQTVHQRETFSKKRAKKNKNWSKTERNPNTRQLCENMHVCSSVVIVLFATSCWMYACQYGDNLRKISEMNESSQSLLTIITQRKWRKKRWFLLLFVILVVCSCNFRSPFNRYRERLCFIAAFHKRMHIWLMYLRAPWI